MKNKTKQNKTKTKNKTKQNKTNKLFAYIIMDISNALRDHNWALFVCCFSKAIVYCYLEFKLRYFTHPKWSFKNHLSLKFCGVNFLVVPLHRKTRVNHLTHLSHSGSVHGQNDSKMRKNESFCMCSDTLYGWNESNDVLGVFSEVILG